MTTLFPLARLLDASLDTIRETAYATDLVPRADVLESDREFRILMDLPGVTNDALDINLENQTLTIKAETNNTVQDGFEIRRHERADQARFSRSFNLGSGVDVDHIAAQLDAGVLQITLPKSKASLARRIEVK